MLKGQINSGAYRCKLKDAGSRFPRQRNIWASILRVFIELAISGRSLSQRALASVSELTNWSSTLSLNDKASAQKISPRYSEKKRGNGMEKRLLSVDEAAQLLGVSQSFLYKLAESKAIPHLRLGRALRFDVVQIDVWLKRQSVDEVDYTNRLRRKRR